MSNLVTAGSWSHFACHDSWAISDDTLKAADREMTEEARIRSRKTSSAAIFASLSTSSFATIRQWPMSNVQQWLGQLQNSEHLTRNSAITFAMKNHINCSRAVTNQKVSLLKFISDAFVKAWSNISSDKTIPSSSQACWIFRPIYHCICFNCLAPSVVYIHRYILNNVSKTNHLPFCQYFLRCMCMLIWIYYIMMNSTNNTNKLILLHTNWTVPKL